MRGRLDGERLRFTTMGVVLCLLAALFAFEAKLAWFSPAGSPPSQISSAKLQPADATRQIAQALAAPTQLHQIPTPVIPAILLLMTVLIVSGLPIRRTVQSRLKVSASPGFIPSQFRRPPPNR